jgi:hypothetical protein
MDFREIAWEGMDWIHLAQDRDQRWAVVDRVMSPWVPDDHGIILTGSTNTTFSRKTAPWSLFKMFAACGPLCLKLFCTATVVDPALQRTDRTD